jgi:hypothetical protein
MTVAALETSAQANTAAQARATTVVNPNSLSGGVRERCDGNRVCGEYGGGIGRLSWCGRTSIRESGRTGIEERLLIGTAARRRAIQPVGRPRLAAFPATSYPLNVWGRRLPAGHVPCQARGLTTASTGEILGPGSNKGAGCPRRWTFHPLRPRSPSRAIDLEEPSDPLEAKGP